ncbi:MAG: VCBS repeat-containing protein [Myxococcales bacterium]|nr:VCBS repeat-containing protein [Myxococcales bacterium]
MRTPSIVLSLASLSLIASCDPRDFNDLADSVWVHAATEPSDSPSKGFGAGLINVGGDELSYFIASKSPPTVFLAKFDAKGSRAPLIASELRGSAILPTAEAFPAQTVMASDPLGFGASEANVAVAAFDNGAPALYMLKGETGEAGTPIALTGSVAPSGIVFGNTGTREGVDLFAVAGTDLNLVANYQTGTSAESCSVGGTTRDILVADVDATEGNELLVVVDGEILVTTGEALASTIADTERTDCFTEAAPPLATITAPAGEADFGKLLRQGDFDGNGSPDLVVGAPADNAVYVFLNWTVAAPSTGTLIDVPSGATLFGAAIAIGDFGTDTDGRDELVISDPSRDVGAHPSAGSVFIYQADASGSFGSPIILHDATPEDKQDFGQSLTVVEASGSSILVVGADNEVFTYFRTPVDGDDDFR